MQIRWTFLVKSAVLFLPLWCCQFACGQAGPVPPLGAPPVPPNNPLTAAKINLGKTLFWEEQLSVTGTVACGSCHRPSGAGADPRTAFNTGNVHPGFDGLIGTADDVRASAGVPAHAADGSYQWSNNYGALPQVGKRKAQSAVNSAYSPGALFWDGRAIGRFDDPITGQTIIQQGGALENQALGPVLDTSEMAYAGASIAVLPNRLNGVKPLALASNIPADLNAWINTRAYPDLFNEAFGSGEVTPARLAMAIASYERTLNSTQTPFDLDNSGTPSLTAQEQRGKGVFGGANCNVCHAGALLSDNSFRYIGLRPAAEDLGRFNQTANPQDRGRFRVPSLRNVESRAPYMHNGRFNTLEEVVEFYNRGGDFNEPNKDPNVRPRNLTPQQKADLVAFLKRPLTDTRVGAELPPFDRPTLYTESTNVPQIIDTGVAGSANIQPQITALEPPILGNRNFTVVVSRALVGAPLTLVVSSSDPGIVSSVPTGSFANVAGMINSDGMASMQLTLPDQTAWVGRSLYGRFYINDPAALNGLAITAAFKITLFGQSDVLLADGME
jgi:cytochrome c peroxidase